MAFNTLPEYSFNSIVPTRVTNLNLCHGDLVHCPVCDHILWKPVTCTSCENSFCFQCIQIWLFEQQEQIIECLDNEDENDYLAKSFSLTRCPFNCSPYIQRKCPSLLISILSKLTIECRNKIYGCEKILFYEQLEKHEEECCQYKIIHCSGCQQDMFKEHFDKEQHQLKCPNIKIKCTKCQSLFQRKDKHNEFDCMEKKIDLLKQELIIFEEKSSKIYDIQRKKIEILDEKFMIIEDICTIDDNNDICSTSVSTQSIGKWNVMIGVEIIILSVFTLLIYIRIFFC
ncbi:unnamed protein product [Adineta steineri]|uniref:TRAF-type domain-containing protein n=1 Tax=Adineta steineri TaxID=433720 RepID=A0A818TLS3_9BILA|nr:unnamed protein product [Adineta steineri]